MLVSIFLSNFRRITGLADNKVADNRVQTKNEIYITKNGKFFNVNRNIMNFLKLFLNYNILYKFLNFYYLYSNILCCVLRLIDL